MPGITDALRATALAAAVLLAGAAHGADAPRVKLVTSMGEVVIELAPDKAPATVENFLLATPGGAPWIDTSLILPYLSVVKSVNSR